MQMVCDIYFCDMWLLLCVFALLLSARSTYLKCSLSFHFQNGSPSYVQQLHVSGLTNYSVHTE